MICMICMIQILKDAIFPGLDMYCTDPAQYLRTADSNLGDVDRDLSDLSIR